MKKKILTLSIILCIVLLIIIFLHIKKEEETKKQNSRRYEEIKRDVKKEIERYTKVIHPICKDNSGGLLITHKTLVYNGGFDKEKLLDVDNKSYCSVYAISGCDENEEYYYNVYIKCKDYEDKGFVKWDEPFPQKNNSIL